MGQIKLYGKGGESCLKALKENNIPSYDKTDKEISDFDSFANYCPYFAYNDELVWTEAHTCDNPSNETFSKNDNGEYYGECSPFYCPFGYLPCKKDYMNLDQHDYELDKETIDKYPDQPYVDAIVVMHNLIRSDLIRHLYKNYNWTMNRYIRNRMFD